jgi:dipeptidyl aminopeptidase/acylaminoacyl peptidase
MAQLFAHDTRSLVPDISRALGAAQPEIVAASPHYYLAKVHVPVMLLHGSADNVVPPTETLWLEHDLPKGALNSALISPAIGHVEVGGATVMDQARLIDWMAKMLELLDRSSGERN